ncbi:MAG: hypothetical protein ACK4VY_01485 [Brevundimonas sp.]
MAALVAAGQAEAQSRTRTLADGRVLTIPASISHCRLAGVTTETAAELALEFACQAPSEEGGPADTAGEGALVILGQAASVSPDVFLAGQVETWWPGIDAASRAENITRSRKATANGDAAVVCVHRDDVEALAGDAVCVLDQPGLQVVIAGRSTMALTADNVVDALMQGMTLR